MSASYTQSEVSHGRDAHKLDLADGRYMSGAYMSGASKRFRKFTLTAGDHQVV